MEKHVFYRDFHFKYGLNVQKVSDEFEIQVIHPCNYHFNQKLIFKKLVDNDYIIIIKNKLYRNRNNKEGIPIL